MSLKAFHLFFVIVATLLCLGFGVWCFVAEEVRGQAGYALAGGLAFAVVVALAIFEVNFLRQTKGLK